MTGGRLTQLVERVCIILTLWRIGGQEDENKKYQPHKLTRAKRGMMKRRITKVKIAQTIIFPILTYGSESWTVRKEDRKKTDAFELWTWRRILQAQWTERRMNLSILEEVKSKRSLDATILQLKLRYFGHIMKAKGSLERDIMLGQVAGYRRQSRPWMRWIHSIKEATGLRLETLKETVKDGKNGACCCKKRLEIGNEQM
jgi:hypothetical protein